MKRGEIWWTAMIGSIDGHPPTDSVALAFQMRAIPRSALTARIRALTADEQAELELATDEALGRADPEDAV